VSAVRSFPSPELLNQALEPHDERRGVAVILSGLLRECGGEAAAVWSVNPENVHPVPRLLAHAGARAPEQDEPGAFRLALPGAAGEVGTLVVAGLADDHDAGPAHSVASLLGLLTGAAQLRVSRDVNRALCLDLARIAKLVRESGGYAEACRRIICELARVFTAESAVILARDERSGQLRPVAHHPHPGGDRNDASWPPDACPALDAAWNRGSWYGVRDTLSASDRGTWEAMLGPGGANVLAFSFGPDQGPEWLVVLAGSPDPELLAGLDRHRIGALGQRFGWLLEGCRTHETLAVSLRNFEELLALSNSLASVFEPEDIPRIVLRRAVDLTEADEAVLCMVEPDGETLRPIHCISEYPDEVLGLRRRIGEGITGTVAADRKAEIVNNAAADPRSTHIPGTPAGEQEAILGAPLLRGDALVGVLTLHKLKGRTFRQVDLDTISLFAAQAAVTMENARLFSGIRAEQIRLATMIRHMHEAVIFGDPQGRVTLLNDAAAALFDSCREGDGVDRVLAHPAFDAVREAVAATGAGDEGGAVEVTHEGRTFLCSVSPVPAPTPGEKLGVVILLQDLSEHRRMHARLLESSKMSAVGQLAAGVAHEFNNLITGIYGYAQLLKMHPDAGTLERGVNVILKSSERAQQLTGSLLTFSRRRTGRREMVQPDEVLRDTLLLLEGEFQKEGIAVVNELGHLPPVSADPGEIQQVFLNLLINTLQALRGRGGSVRIEGSATPAAIDIRIADDGPGVAPEHRARVFEPFFTTKGSLAGAPVPGVGLGLTTAFNIVEGHGGSLVLEDREGPGASFRITLPRRPGPDSLTRGERAVPVAARPHVAVAVRDAAELEAAESVLTEIGCRVSACDMDGDCFKSLLDSGVDLLILDGLPGVGGTSHYVTARAAVATLPIVFLADRNEGLEFPGLSDSWTFLLRKPYRRRDLASTVSRVLQHCARRAS